MSQIEPKIYEKLRSEPMFSLFKHLDLYCCIQRFAYYGSYNGYVAIDSKHPLFGKDCSYEVKVPNLREIEFNGNYLGLFILNGDNLANNSCRLDLFLNAHGGITFAREYCPGIELNIFPEKLWWFGFDTMHCDDKVVFQDEFSVDLGSFTNAEYRDYEYMKKEIHQLAKQLAEFGGETGSTEAFNIKPKEITKEHEND